MATPQWQTALSAKYPGNQRRVWVYTPANYQREGKPHAALLLLDGEECTTLIPTPTILDNLLYEGKIAPCVAVFFETLGSTRYEELGCSLPFVDCLTQELLPWLRQHYAVTTDRTQITIGGVSASGLAAAFTGLTASECSRPAPIMNFQEILRQQTVGRD